MFLIALLVLYKEYPYWIAVSKQVRAIFYMFANAYAKVTAFVVSASPEDAWIH